MAKCWICQINEANSGEHKFKASDIKRNFGKRNLNILYINQEINEIEKFKSEISAYKTEIEYLENKKNELKKIKESKILEINLLNKENVKLEGKISGFENETIELKTKINILEDINRKSEIEIERQKNLKWYQKLVGKK